MTPSLAPSDLHFNPHDPAFSVDPHPLMRRFRAEAPIYYWEAARAYVFFRYRDIAALLREPRLITDPTLGAGFPAALRAKYPDFVEMRENGIFLLSPAAHSRIRRLLNPMFTSKALEPHRPRIVEILDSVLDQLPREGTINAFADFASKFPVRVIAALVGVPPGDEEDFHALSKALLATLVPGIPAEVFASYMPAMSRGAELVRACIAERRAQPRDGDLLGFLINACDDEGKLTDGELLSLIGAILIGGSDTVVHLMTYTLHELLRHPDQLALLRAEPELARGAIDETSRYNSATGPGLPRYVNEPFTYEGIELKRGQPLFLNLLSGMRDPEFLPDADVYDIRRRQARTPWFGYGPHFCIGAALVRIEAEAALQMFLARYPRIELAGPVVYGSHPILRAIIDLPLRVGPAA